MAQCTPHGIPVDRMLSGGPCASTDHRPVEPAGALKELLDEVRTILGTRVVAGLAPPELAHLGSLLFSRPIPESDWRPFLFFKADGYARNLIEQGSGNFDLLLVAWLPSQSRYAWDGSTLLIGCSCIHDHAGSHCLMRVLEGTVEEALYDTPAGGGLPLLPKQPRMLSAGQGSYIHDAMGVHSVGNPTGRPAVTLHLYSPPILQCQVFGDHHPGTQRAECAVDSYRGIPAASCAPRQPGSPSARPSSTQRPAG